MMDAGPTPEGTATPLFAKPGEGSMCAIVARLVSGRESDPMRRPGITLKNELRTLKTVPETMDGLVRMVGNERAVLW